MAIHRLARASMGPEYWLVAIPMPIYIYFAILPSHVRAGGLEEGSRARRRWIRVAREMNQEEVQ